MITDYTIHKLVKGDRDDPAYEVEAPAGYHWTRPVEGHFFVAWTKHGIRQAVRTASIEPCPLDCDCKE